MVHLIRDTNENYYAAKISSDYLPLINEILLDDPSYDIPYTSINEILKIIYNLLF